MERRPRARGRRLVHRLCRYVDRRHERVRSDAILSQQYARLQHGRLSKSVSTATRPHREWHVAHVDVPRRMFEPGIGARAAFVENTREGGTVSLEGFELRP